MMKSNPIINKVLLFSWLFFLSFINIYLLIYMCSNNSFYHILFYYFKKKKNDKFILKIFQILKNYAFWSVVKKKQKEIFSFIEKKKKTLINIIQPKNIRNKYNNYN